MVKFSIILTLELLTFIIYDSYSETSIFNIGENINIILPVATSVMLNWIYLSIISKEYNKTYTRYRNIIYVTNILSVLMIILYFSLPNNYKNISLILSLPTYIMFLVINFFPKK